MVRPLVLSILWSVDVALLKDAFVEGEGAPARAIAYRHLARTIAHLGVHLRRPPRGVPLRRPPQPSTPPCPPAASKESRSLKVQAASDRHG
mgnify:CR=1 FL=1